MKKKRRTSQHRESIHTDQPSETFVVTRLDQLKAIAHPLRQQLFERFAEKPTTTKQVADLLELKPTRLYHHVALLEEAGLIHLVSTKKIRGATAKYYSAVAKTVRIDPTVMRGDASESALAAAGLDVVEGLLTGVKQDLTRLLDACQDDDSGREQEVIFESAELRGTPAQIAELRTRIHALILAFDEASKSKDTDASTDVYRLLLGIYPYADTSKAESRQ